MTAEQLEGKILTGVLYKEEKPEYTAEYAKVIVRAKGEQVIKLLKEKVRCLKDMKSDFPGLAGRV